LVRVFSPNDSEPGLGGTRNWGAMDGRSVNRDGQEGCARGDNKIIA